MFEVWVVQVLKPQIEYDLAFWFCLLGFATLASLICKIPQMVIWMIFQKLMDYSCGNLGQSCGNLGQSGKPNVVCKTNASCFSIISIFMFENSVLPFAGEVWWFYPSLPLQSLISLWMCCFLLVESAIFVDLIFIFWWSKYRCSFVQALLFYGFYCLSLHFLWVELLFFGVCRVEPRLFQRCVARRVFRSRSGLMKIWISWTPIMRCGWPVLPVIKCFFFFFLLGGTIYKVNNIVNHG